MHSLSRLDIRLDVKKELQADAQQRARSRKKQRIRKRKQNATQDKKSAAVGIPIFQLQHSGAPVDFARVLDIQETPVGQAIVQEILGVMPACLLNMIYAYAKSVHKTVILEVPNASDRQWIHQYLQLHYPNVHKRNLKLPISVVCANCLDIPLQLIGGSLSADFQYFECRNCGDITTISGSLGVDINDDSFAGNNGIGIGECVEDWNCPFPNGSCVFPQRVNITRIHILNEAWPRLPHHLWERHVSTILEELDSLSLPDLPPLDEDWE